MDIDMGGFLANLAPIFMSFIVFPLVLLCIFIIARAQWKQYRRNQDKLKTSDAAASGATTNAVEATAAPQFNALDLLREARSESGTPTRSFDTGDLPDLDLLMRPEKPRPTNELREIRPEPQKLKLSTGRVASAKELLTVLRDETDGRLMVQIGSTGYRTLLDSADAKKEFTRLMKELSGVIMTDDVQPEEPVIPDFLTEADAPEDPLPSVGGLLGRSNRPAVTPAPAAAMPAPEVPQPKRTAPPPPPKDGAMPGMLPSYKFDDNPATIQVNRSGFVKKVDFTPPPEADIPGAIEAYLQYKIQYTPEYQGREIHVRRSAGGGVRIQVGPTFYEAVDDVSEPDVKQFIKEAISEWQERQ